MITRTNSLPYAHAGEHLADELQRIDCYLEIARTRVIIHKNGSSNPDSVTTEVVLPGIEKLRAKKELIAARVSAPDAKALPLEQLRSIFQLSRLEMDLLVICMAPAIDARYGNSFAVLAGGGARRCATLALCGVLLDCEGIGMAAIRGRLSERAPLLRHRLLEFRPELERSPVTRLETPLFVDERIVDFALGNAFLDPRLADFLCLDEERDPAAVRASSRSSFDRILNALRTRAHEPRLIHLSGPNGSPFRETAAAISSGLGLPLLKLDCSRLAQNPIDPRGIFPQVLREARLLGAALFLEGPAEGDIGNFLREAATFPGLYFIADHRPELREARPGQFRLFTLFLPLPDFQESESLWSRELESGRTRLAGISTQELATSFRFTAGQIRGAVLRARNTTLFHESGPVTDEDGALFLSADTLIAACRAESNRKLSDLARRVPAKFTWDDIILPGDSMRQLREIQNHVRFSETVYSHWGFEKQLLSGRGLNVLFSGTSGTGKTMAATILAGELRLELYKIDLSTVVSKYIGETEKNLSRIFAEAETSNAVLFFDEADALFGKRSEVRDAHDRHANIEVGYLLQKMEDYGGICVLATNLSENIDNAFIRRLHFIVEFPFPDRRERERIWRIAFPIEAPRAEELDYPFLGEKIKLTGGGIKSVALNAAFLAASEERPITMRHVLSATRREFRKAGRTLLPADLGRYAELAREEVA